MHDDVTAFLFHLLKVDRLASMHQRHRGNELAQFHVIPRRHFASSLSFHLGIVRLLAGFAWFKTEPVFGFVSGDRPMFDAGGGMNLP